MDEEKKADNTRKSRTPRAFPVVEASKEDGAGDNEGRLRNVSGPRIKLRRLQLGWSQQRLAEEIAQTSGGEWNPTQPDVRRVEGQRRIISDQDLLHMASALRCAAAWLLDEKEAPDPNAPSS